jgi:CheY-like chemotaxis protein
MRVLVCDDNQDAADTLTLLLRTHGHEVKTAYQGDACLQVALEWRPQIAFLDIGMPDVSGFGVARRLRAELGAEIMLVAITGYASREDKQLANEAGFDLHMSKPADFSRVVAVVQERKSRAAR